jgi:hypothetical protein
MKRQRQSQEPWGQFRGSRDHFRRSPITAISDCNHSQDEERYISPGMAAHAFTQHGASCRKERIRLVAGLKIATLTTTIDATTKSHVNALAG